MVKRRSNIQEVARRAGVSIATVSRSFATPERLSPGTLDLVRAAVRELDYTPNAQARSLRMDRTMLVVALVPDISNPFFSGVIRGVERVAGANGYAVLLGDTQHDAGNEQRYGDMVSSGLVDGLLTLLPRVPTIQRPGRLPVVNACEPIDDPAVSSVVIDNASAFHDGVRHLVTIGHRSIAFVGGSPASPLTMARRRGYDTAMTAAGLPIHPQLCRNDDFSIEAGIRTAERILSSRLPVTAFACACDELAVGVIHALRGHGLDVPADVSVLGFDDIGIARYLAPPLTTIAQPREEMGSEAMLMLLELLRDRGTPPRKQILPTSLVIRGSTAPPR